MNPFLLAIVILFAGSTLVLRRQLGNLITLILLAGAAVVGAYAAGFVELPDLEDTVERAGSTLGAWTYLLVGVLAFLEAGAFIGLLMPGEFAVVFGGIIAGRGDINLVVLITVVWFAATAGDVASYFFGRRVGRGFALRHGDRFGVTEKRLAWAERYFAAHGRKTIVIGRFIGIVRALAPFIAGTSRMCFRKFLIADVIGTGLWAVTFCVLGFIFWRSLDRALELARDGKLGLFGLLLLAGLVFLVYRLVGTPEHRANTRAWLRANVPYLARREARRQAAQPTPEPDENDASAADGSEPALSKDRTEI